LIAAWRTVTLLGASDWHFAHPKTQMTPGVQQ
jgi:hypothetical protein